MPLDFRLSYKEGINYTDLFPQVSIDSIEDGQHVYQNVVLPVTIPASQDVTQTITITTDAKMPVSRFDVFLVSTGEQAEIDYSTITQMEVQTNQLIVTRLEDKPTGSIDVILLFYEQRGDV